MAISWAQAGVDPKRRFKFKLKLGDVAEYYVKTATMPKANVSTIEHSYFDYNFKFPDETGAEALSLSKQGFSDAFGGDPQLQLMDGFGSIIEEWTLRNAFLTNVDYGGSLDYTSDEMLELSMEISFDWAQKTQSG